MFGVVIVGVGLAGKVRIRDLLSPLQSSPGHQLTLKGFVSRRSLDDVGVKQISLEEALNRDDIHAAIVCTENITHEEYIRRFLQAGKHVCVEYPMALSHTAAVELFELADQKGKVLHVEHIELLTSEYKQLKEDISGKKLVEGKLHFTGGPTAPGFGFPSFSGISRLTWLVDLFGELTVTAASVEEQPETQRTKLTAHFLTKEQRPLTWVEERAAGLSRGKSIDFRFSCVTLDKLPATARDSVGLFTQDMCAFSMKLQGRVDTESVCKERQRVLHCLKLAECVQQLTQSQ